MNTKFFSKNYLTALASTALFLAVSLPGSAATAFVTVNNTLSGGFVPATANINQGDRVIWTWPSGSTFHNVTSTSVPQAWPASATLSGPATFTNTFDTAGSFPYECTIHLFTGSINVAPANTPPSVSITNPAPGAVFSEPADVKIQAIAGDPDSGGSVTNVQFRLDAAILTNETAAPFVAIAGGLAAGGYSLSAVATDNFGAKTTNTVSISVVTPVALELDAAQQISATAFQFNYSANAGLSYIVQRATQLTPPDWVTLVTNKAAGNPEVFTDLQATNNPGFYRVERLPNP
jgi:plastocyanin